MRMHLQNLHDHQNSMVLELQLQYSRLGIFLVPG